MSSGDLSPLSLLHPLSGAILFTWIYNHTNGSVLIAMLVHAAADTAAGLFGVFSGSNALLYEVWLAAAFVAMAILLRVFTGPDLGRKPEAVMYPIAAEQPMAAD